MDTLLGNVHVITIALNAKKEFGKKVVLSSVRLSLALPRSLPPFFGPGLEI